MIRQETENFSLEQICRSGQCFRMHQDDDGRYHVIAGGRYLAVRQQGNQCDFFCDEAEFEQFWKEYFDLDGDYAGYMQRINPRDTYLVNAAAFGSGVRILRQDLWEMIVSFLISQQNNLIRIRRCIQNICEKYGDRLMNEAGVEYYGFPQPEALAGLGEDDLKACNLGYRSKYVVRAARSVASGETDLDAVRQMPYQQAKEAFLKLFGVGDKVADCICLFALHHLQAFPVDTHIRQALEAHYRRGFPHRRYQGVQGVIQQYIFYYELCGKTGKPDIQEEQNMLKAGMKAPDFTLMDKDGRQVSLSDFAGKKVVLYFYPKDNTPGCTRQACAFAGAYRQFEALGVQVIGISKDSIKSHQNFAAKYELPFLLLSDPELQAIQAYDVWKEKKLYGKVSMGVVRSTYIIDENGMIEKAMEKVKPDTNAAEILEYLSGEEAK